MKYLVVYVILVSKLCLSQIPPGYYAPAAGLTGAPLKLALHNIIKSHTVVSYASLWTAFQKTDITPTVKVWDVYSDIPGGTPPYVYTFVSDQCGSYSVEGDCYNREHSWPQSWFSSVTGPVSDMFHIYPTDGKVNGVRNNYPYGNVSTVSWTSLNGSKLGACSDLGYSSTVFEPLDEYKGDLARGYFYMSTRYFSEDGSWSFSDATNKSDILPWEVNVLLQWHHDDPVSAKEIARNDSIYYKFQHNRNPFIDNPQWADSIWKVDVTLFVKDNELKNAFSIFPNPAVDSFTILSKLNDANSVKHIRITTIDGEVIEENDVTFTDYKSYDCKMWASGLYIITVSSEKSISNFRFLKL